MLIDIPKSPFHIFQIGVTHDHPNFEQYFIFGIAIQFLSSVTRSWEIETSNALRTHFVKYCHINYTA